MDIQDWNWNQNGNSLRKLNYFTVYLNCWNFNNSSKRESEKFPNLYMTMMSIYEWKQQVEFKLILQCSAIRNVWQKYSRRIQIYIPKKTFNRLKWFVKFKFYQFIKIHLHVGWYHMHMCNALRSFQKKYFRDIFLKNTMRTIAVRTRNLHFVGPGPGS